MSDTTTLSRANRKLKLGDIDFDVKPLTYQEIGELEGMMRDWYQARVEDLTKRVGSAAAQPYIDKMPGVLMAISSTITPRITRFIGENEERPPEAERYRRHWVVFNNDHPDTEAWRAMVQYLGSLDGATAYVFLSIRTCKPDVTMPEIGRLLVDQATRDRALDKLEEINRAAASSNASQPDAKATEQKKT